MPTRAAAEFLGRSVDQIIGHTDEELFPDDAADTIQRLLHRALETGESQRKVYPVALVAIDMDEGRVVEANRGIDRIYGYSPDEIAGMSLSDIDLFLNPERMENVRERAMQEGEVRETHLQARREDGEVRDILLSAVRVDLEHRTYLVGASRDISPHGTAREVPPGGPPRPRWLQVRQRHRRSWSSPAFVDAFAPG